MSDAALMRRLEMVVATPKWWQKMTKAEQEAYVKKHPKTPLKKYMKHGTGFQPSKKQMNPPGGGGSGQPNTQQQQQQKTPHKPAPRAPRLTPAMQTYQRNKQKWKKLTPEERKKELAKRINQFDKKRQWYAKKMKQKRTPIKKKIFNSIKKSTLSRARSGMKRLRSGDPLENHHKNALWSLAYFSVLMLGGAAIIGLGGNIAVMYALKEGFDGIIAAGGKATAGVTVLDNGGLIEGEFDPKSKEEDEEDDDWLDQWLDKVELWLEDGEKTKVDVDSIKDS